MNTQKTLDEAQIAAFYHDLFVTDQVRDFETLVRPEWRDGVVVDVGGGCGFFAAALRERFGLRTRVIDSDPVSVDAARATGVEAVVGDALAPPVTGEEAIACFNLILHHLVGAGERTTRALQSGALDAWRGRVPFVFVNEYIYESYGPRDVSARLIYAITNSRVLSAVAKTVSRVVPTLKANTFGVGVRFRSAHDWRDLFAACGYEVVAATRGADEPVSAARRLMLIRSCRRDSFVLRARG